MIPWVGNLVFSFQIKVFTIPTKIPTKPYNYIYKKTKQNELKKKVVKTFL
jgi:hypothetical protein